MKEMRGVRKVLKKTEYLDHSNCCWKGKLLIMQDGFFFLRIFAISFLLIQIQFQNIIGRNHHDSLRGVWQDDYALDGQMVNLNLNKVVLSLTSSRKLEDLFLANICL